MITKIAFVSAAPVSLVPSGSMSMRNLTTSHRSAFERSFLHRVPRHSRSVARRYLRSQRPWARLSLIATVPLRRRMPRVLTHISKSPSNSGYTPRRWESLFGAVECCDSGSEHPVRIFKWYLLFLRGCSFPQFKIVAVCEHRRNSAIKVPAKRRAGAGGGTSQHGAPYAKEAMKS